MHTYVCVCVCVSVCVSVCVCVCVSYMYDIYSRQLYFLYFIIDLESHPGRC